MLNKVNKEYSYEMMRFRIRICYLVFTALTGTDLRIISWVCIRIASVSSSQRAQIWIEYGFPAIDLNHTSESAML